MPNKIKGEVSLNGPEGETFILQFGFESLVLVEDQRDKSFGAVVEELKSGRLGSLAALLWAGLQAHHEDISFEDAGRLAMAIAGSGNKQGADLQNKIIEAINLAFPAAKKKEVDASASRPPTETASSTSSDISAPGAS